jgi:hypothetical protein
VEWIYTCNVNSTLHYHSINVSFEYISIQYGKLFYWNNIITQINILFGKYGTIPYYILFVAMLLLMVQHENKYDYLKWVKQRFWRKERQKNIPWEKGGMETVSNPRERERERSIFKCVLNEILEPPKPPSI